MHGREKRTKEGDILKSKFITSILKGGTEGDVCNKKRLFDQYWLSFNFEIVDSTYEYEYIKSLKKMFPEINTFKYKSGLFFN